MTEYMQEVTKVLGDAIENPDTNPAGLIGRLMSANFRDYSNTTSWLMENYQRQIADLEAELGAIRTRINELFAGDYMPSETAIVQAVFYPSRTLIDQCRKPEFDQ